MFKANASKFKALFLIGILFNSCSNDSETSTGYSEKPIQLATHKLMTYSVQQNSKYLVVFESGLGDGHQSWNPTDKKSGVIELASEIHSDILLYDRAGYGKSGNNDQSRNISTLRSELETVIDQTAKGRKVILVGHSLGGMIIRDYAVKNPQKTAALLFVDSMHEFYNKPELEDVIYNILLTSYGKNFGGTEEAHEIAADIAYAGSLPNLPNIPIVALTSMKHDDNNNASDLANEGSREKWFQAHEQLGKGITDFTHIATVKSGHYIHQEEPELLIRNIKLLLSKLPI